MIFDMEKDIHKSFKKMPLKIQEIKQQIDTLNEIKEQYSKTIQRLDFEQQILTSALGEIERKIEMKQDAIQDIYKRNLIPLNIDRGDANG